MLSLLLIVVVSSVCRLLVCPLSYNEENVSCHSSRLGFCMWPKQTILRNTRQCLKRLEYINLRETEALRAKKSGSKSGFGHFGTYITWSKMGHVLPMFEALPWFPVIWGYSPGSLPWGLRLCVLWQLRRLWSHSAPHPSHLTLLQPRWPFHSWNLSHFEVHTHAVSSSGMCAPSQHQLFRFSSLFSS